MVCVTGCPKSPNIILYYIILWLHHPCILQRALYREVQNATVKRLSMNSSLEQPPIETKLSQITDATLRGATWAKKLLPWSVRQKTEADRPPSWIYGENIRFLGMLLCCQYKRGAPTVVRELLRKRPIRTNRFQQSQYGPWLNLKEWSAQIICCRGARGKLPWWTNRRPS